MRFLFNKKGQAAVEYLVTYGWAFIAILSTIGVMSYFGLLNPERYIPDSCEFGEQLQCQNQYIDDSPIITIRFENNFEEPITVTEVYGTDITRINGGGTIDLDRGEIKRIDIDTSRTLFAGEKESFSIIIEFQRDDGLTPKLTQLHDVSGRLFGQVQESNLLLFT